MMLDVLNSPRFPELGEIDFSSSLQIRHLIKDRYRCLFGPGDDDFIDEYFSTVEDLFAGCHPEFQAMDTAYHDITHTLQATLCLAELIYHRGQEEVSPSVEAHDFRRALIAILFHDIGFLKKVGDNGGTGAKYCHVHEHRSCVFARKLLKARDWPEDDIRFVENLISSTGPRADLTKIGYRSPVERLLGQIVCTADYIGQMSDPRYPDRLEPLFREFEENYRYRRLPQSEWQFKSFETLLRGTPAFWECFVQKKLNEQCAGVWRHLECPVTGKNPYLDALTGNLAKIREMISMLDAPAAIGNHRPSCTAGHASSPA